MQNFKIKLKPYEVSWKRWRYNIKLIALRKAFEKLKNENKSRKGI